MSQPTSPPSTFARYDLVRRKRLLQVLLPLLIAAIVLAWFDYVVRFLVSSADQLLFNLVSSVVIAGILVGFVGGLIALRRDAISSASALMVGTGSLGLIAVLIRHILLQGLDPVGLLEFLILPTITVLTSFLAVLGCWSSSPSSSMASRFLPLCWPPPSMRMRMSS